jgi:hypothetical protein
LSFDVILERRTSLAQMFGEKKRYFTYTQVIAAALGCRTVLIKLKDKKIGIV